MARIPYWRKNLQAWNKPTIAGRILPGTVTLSPFGPMLNIQEGAASGKDGGKVVVRGLKFSRATLTLEIDTEEDFDTFLDLSRVLVPVEQPQARDLLSVYHPLLALWGFTRGLVEHPEITPPRNGGPMVVKITLLMVFERDNATHTPTNSPASTVATVESIPLGGDARQFRDVRDRSRPTVP